MIVGNNKKKAVDTQYRDLLQQILDKGSRAKSQQGVDALTLIGPNPMHFKLANGFPIITERKISQKIWQQAIGEMCGFINGARTQKELSEEFSCHWWQAWVTEKKCKKRGLETGDLGPGSYGAAFHDFPTVEGETYNQIKYIIQQIKERPHLRTHFISPWVPQYTMRVKGRQQKVVVCPCHGWIHLRVIDNKLTLHMFQRSADVPIGVPANMAQYAALTMMIAHATGLEPYEYVHSFSDAHIYVDQIPKIQEMFERQPLKLPVMEMTEKTNIFDYRATDFKLSDYEPHKGIWDIPVAI
jgi:thymidylate synthase